VCATLVKNKGCAEDLKISVNAKAQNFQSLERKLRRGKNLERAAAECGIDIAAASSYLEAQRAARPFDDDALRIAAGEMLHHGVKTLIELTKLRDGRLGSDGENLGEFGGSMTKKWEFPDLPAAVALVNGALKIRALIAPKGRAPGRGPGADLFDGDGADEDGNWSFPKKD
jgi:hypothetical protein